MKKEYDFAQGERGKFYHPDLELKLPVYLETDVAEFLQELSDRKGTDIEKIVAQIGFSSSRLIAFPGSNAMLL